MKLSIQQTLLPGDTLSERFQRAAEYGFAGIEIAVGRLPGSLAEQVPTIEAAVAASGLAVGSICTTSGDDFVHPDPAERESRLAGLVANLQAAEALGARGVIALPIRPPAHLPDLSPVADERSLITQVAAVQLRAALEQTAGSSVQIFLEPLNRYEAYYLRTIRQTADLCRLVGDLRLKVMGDLFHMSIEEADIAAALQAEALLIGHVHLADSNRLLPGHGHTDFVPPFRALRAAGFEGWLALECGVPGDPAEVLPASVCYLQQCWNQAALL